MMAAALHSSCFCPSVAVCLCEIQNLQNTAHLPISRVNKSGLFALPELNTAH